jgi:hypothetical protein
MTRKSSDWYVRNGCELQNPSMKMFEQVYSMSGGNPCDGCNCKDTCNAWPLVNTSSSKSQPTTSTEKVETNAEIAARLGISKRQVAKRRKQGQL